MNDINFKLNNLSSKLLSDSTIKILILGLGSVGSYLLDYLMSWTEENIELHIGTRSYDKAAQNVNIVKVANLIRYQRMKSVTIHKLDLEDVDSIVEVFKKVAPDFIINSSRVYSGLKYGSISWHNIRSYGLWSPLSIKYIRNIMYAYKKSASFGIVINTSYSDVVNCWLKSAGLVCPDFGSGNINHLIPRIKIAVAEQLGIDDYSNIEVILATSHFHDVVISKEGHTEGLDPLVHLLYRGDVLNIDMVPIYAKCSIVMPSDSRRNMMNASSNYEIIAKIIDAIKSNSTHIIHTPGVMGYMGGYPVRIDFRRSAPSSKRSTFVEDYFSLKQMEEHNKASIALDGVEGISNGMLIYTDLLREKVKRIFGVSIPKNVHFDEVEEMGLLLINKIIIPAVDKGNEVNNSF